MARSDCPIDTPQALTVNVKPGRAARRCEVVESEPPEDLIFQSIKTGGPPRDKSGKAHVRRCAIADAVLDRAEKRIILEPAKP